VPLTTTVTNGVATIRLDDGKVNALDAQLVADLRAELREASSCDAVILTGRTGVLTAGLDTRALAAMSAPQRLEFFVDFGRLVLELWTLPVPVVCAATGHAIAAGTLLALASDHVVAARGEFRWGMTEARIGLELSDYAIMMVRSRVAPAQADKLLLAGHVLDPGAAVASGLADELADPELVDARAIAAARDLAQLPRVVFARNKARLRADRSDLALVNLRADVERFIPPTSTAEVGTGG
jgi:enoyl-CoA hydratase/carnithine racemase